MTQPLTLPHTANLRGNTGKATAGAFNNWSTPDLPPGKLGRCEIAADILRYEVIDIAEEGKTIASV